MQAFVSLDIAHKLPILETCMPYDPDSTFPCSVYECTDQDPSLSLGAFSYVTLSNIWEVQEQIRTFGSAMTRLNVHDDFKPFFEANPNGVYPGPSEFVLCAACNVAQNLPIWKPHLCWG